MLNRNNIANNLDWNTFSRGSLPNISPAEFKAEAVRLAALFEAADTDEDEIWLALEEHDWVEGADWETFEDQQAALDTLFLAGLPLS